MSDNNSNSNAKEISISMTIILVFLTHTVVNTLLLLPWNSLRCSFWNVYTCTADEDWMLNWFTFARFHLLILLICLAKSSMGSILLEQRLLVLCSVLMLNFVSTGIYGFPSLYNKAMAGLQCLIYLTLITISLHHLTTSSFVPLPTQLRSLSFDVRRRLPLSTVAVGIQCLLSFMRVSDLTFGAESTSPHDNVIRLDTAAAVVDAIAQQRKGYQGDSSSPVFQIMQHAAVNDMFFTALVLGAYFLMGTVPQQKTLLVGQAAALFVSQAMLASPLGEMINPEQVKAGGVATFFSMVIAILGVM